MLVKAVKNSGIYSKVRIAPINIRFYVE